MKQLRICMKYELRKLLLGAKGWLVIVAALVLQIGMSLTAKPHLPSDFDPALYRQMVASYAGVYTPETEQRVQMALEAAQLRIQTYSRRPSAGSDGDLIERARQLSFAQEDEAVLRALMEKCASLRDIQDLQPELTYDLELKDYLRRFGVNWASLIGIALLMPVLMLRDTTCGMAQMLDASFVGRKKRIQAKLLTAAVLSAGVTLVCSLLQVVLFAIINGLLVMRLVATGWISSNLKAR